MDNNHPKRYPLLISLLFSTAIVGGFGIHLNNEYYQQNILSFNESASPISMVMNGLHDGNVSLEMDKLIAKWYSLTADELLTANEYTNIYMTRTERANITTIINNDSIAQDNLIIPETIPVKEALNEPEELITEPVEETPIPLSDSIPFSVVTDEYFDDAVFIGDSRTVGISSFSGIDNATFLCKTSLTIYDYYKKKITYNNIQTSIHDVLTKHSFGKIYVMLGINESTYGTTESYFNEYKNVIDDIRQLQPGALIFVEGSLLITEELSNSTANKITNQTLMERNDAISKLANQEDIFYIDINESSLCENNALIPDYTWDQIHIKAQYYPMWKEFLLKHGVI